jgi:threonine dehydrogenase-like Zn-dependent dehydrogenase
MKALCWEGVGRVRVESVPDPKILNPRDAIVRITSTAICGSDLHLYDGFISTMAKGDILGHEVMGEVVELGHEVMSLGVGARVVVPATATDRTHAVRQAIVACRKGGTVSIPGVYGGLLDKFPLGMAFAKGLTSKMGQTHVQRYMKPLLERIRKGEIDPTFVITHRMRLDDAADGYAQFKQHQDECIKIVLKP